MVPLPREILTMILLARKATMARDAFTRATRRIESQLRFPHSLPLLGPPWYHFALRRRRVLHHTWAVGPEIRQTTLTRTGRHVTRRQLDEKVIHHYEGL